MRISTFCSAASFCLFASASMPGLLADSLPPIRIILVGDSTMAVGSGYGPGFCAAVAAEVTCLDMAKGGRSTKSYREEGSWAQVTEALAHKDAFKATYVLIQFGHNDQPGKPRRSTDLRTEFPANMRRYVEDVRSAGGKPVLVTPLTRRMFRDGKLDDTLGPWADTTRTVAREESVPLLDLYAESSAAVQKLGPEEANTFAMAPPPPPYAESARTGTSRPLPPKKPSSPGSEPRAMADPCSTIRILVRRGRLTLAAWCWSSWVTQFRTFSPTSNNNEST